MNFQNKVAIVNGGGRDIGAQVSQKLAAEGASVCIVYHGGAAAALATKQTIDNAGGKAVLVQADMTKPSGVQTAVQACLDAFGPEIHVLVNVVGGLVGRKLIPDMDELFWDTVMALNIKAPFLATQAVLPHMKAGGSIVHFSSQAARDGGGFGAIAYASAKGAVLTMTKGMAKELGPQGIRVNCVSPGMINTTFHNTFTKDEVRKNVAAATPLRREGNAAEVADLVLYLASDRASFVTGASVEINGGTYYV